MKMKKILAMLLAMTMAMALAACGGKNASAPSGGNNAGQSGEATPPQTTAARTKPLRPPAAS